MYPRRGCSMWFTDLLIPCFVMLVVLLCWLFCYYCRPVWCLSLSLTNAQTYMHTYTHIHTYIHVYILKTMSYRLWIFGLYAMLYATSPVTITPAMESKFSAKLMEAEVWCCFCFVGATHIAPRTFSRIFWDRYLSEYLCLFIGMSLGIYLSGCLIDIYRNFVYSLSILLSC